MGVVNWRMWLARTLGMTHDGARDMYNEFGYPQSLEFSDYFDKYRRQNIARRIVNLPVNTTWAGGITIEGPDEFVKAWKRAAKQAHLLGVIKRADKLAGLGTFAVIVLGINDGRRLRDPVRPGSERKLLYAQAYSQGATKIKEIDQDPNSMRFGLPISYTIQTKPLHPDNVGQGAPAPTNIPTEVHYTRVVHIAEDLLENEIYGTPRLEAVFNDLQDLLKISGSTAETYWMTANRGMQANIDREASLGEDELKELEDELEKYMHRLSRIVKTRGVDLESLGSDTPSPKEAFEMLIALLAGASGIPQRILLGSEAGHLASEQDRANMAQRIEERREEYAEPIILDQLIERLQGAGVLPILTEDVEITYKWQDAFIQSPLERNQTMAQKARATINLSRQLEKPEAAVLERNECREILGFPPIVLTSSDISPTPTQEEAEDDDEGTPSNSQETSEEEEETT